MLHVNKIIQGMDNMNIEFFSKTKRNSLILGEGGLRKNKRK